MGEGKSSATELQFNRSVKVEFDDERITSNAGVVLFREMDDRLMLFRGIAAKLIDARRQDLIRYPLAELLRERIFVMALGYSAQDDSRSLGS